MTSLVPKPVRKNRMGLGMRLMYDMYWKQWWQEWELSKVVCVDSNPFLAMCVNNDVYGKSTMAASQLDYFSRECNYIRALKFKY